MSSCKGESYDDSELSVKITELSTPEGMGEIDVASVGNCHNFLGGPRSCTGWWFSRKPTVQLNDGPAFLIHKACTN